MSCPRCNSQTQTIMEYIQATDKVYVRDIYCSNCKSVVVEKFFNDNTYSSEWIDLNVED